MLDRLRQELTSVAANIERAKERGAPSWPLNEANTKRIVVEPLLRALGYDDFDYVKEPFGVGADFLDYLVLPGTDQKWVLEAKEWDARLIERFERQAVNYANNNGAQWAVLTNGRMWWFYNRSAGGDLHQQRVYELADICNTDCAVDVLSRLSRESVVGGLLDREYRGREIWGALREELLAGNRKIVKAMQLAIGRRLDKHVSDQDVIDALRVIVPAETVAAPVGPKSVEETAPPAELVRPPEGFITLADLVESPGLCTGTRPACVRGLGAEAMPTSTWRDVAVFVVEHSPASALGLLPFAAGPRAKRYFLNLEPKHSDGGQMRAPRLISWAGAQVYAELHYSAGNLLLILSHWLRSLGIDIGSVEVNLVGNNDEPAESDPLTA